VDIIKGFLSEDDESVRHYRLRLAGVSMRNGGRKNLATEIAPLFLLEEK
jgi:hypothetical protein